MKRAAWRAALPGAGFLVACSTAGSTWMSEPLTAGYDPLLESSATTAPAPPPRTRPPAATRLGTGEPPAPVTEGGTVAGGAVAGGAVAGGRSLGTFRNTYYDFPSEADFEGPAIPLMSKSCGTIASVPREFYEAVCVQGSGTLKRGTTVSFARRDCDCAELCPRTGQKICFDELEARDFPWGRGATGKAITPLLTVAVDSDVIPLGTALYVPELDGLPRDPEGRAAHDGCFIAQDRGLKVKGQHIDIFTGHRSVTLLWNRRVPSNRGVTVVVDSPRCSRAN
ncbi:MAG TPA: 3D domain-containing protein [Polyangiaceae bacterium]